MPFVLTKRMVVVWLVHVYLLGFADVVIAKNVATADPEDVTTPVGDATNLTLPSDPAGPPPDVGTGSGLSVQTEATQPNSDPERPKGSTGSTNSILKILQRASYLLSSREAQKASSAETPLVLTSEAPAPNTTEETTTAPLNETSPSSIPDDLDFDSLFGPSGPSTSASDPAIGPTQDPWEQVGSSSDPYLENYGFGPVPDQNPWQMLTLQDGGVTEADLFVRDPVLWDARIAFEEQVISKVVLLIPGFVLGMLLGLLLWLLLSFSFEIFKRFFLVRSGPPKGAKNQEHLAMSTMKRTSSSSNCSGKCESLDAPASDSQRMELQQSSPSSQNTGQAMGGGSTSGDSGVTAATRPPSVPTDCEVEGSCLECRRSLGGSSHQDLPAASGAQKS